MEFEMKSHVYIKVDEQGRIVRCEGEYTLPSDLTDWILIEEGQPCDRLNLAQSRYFPGGLYTMDGIHRYRWDGEKAVLRSEEELEADRDAIPEPEPSGALESRVAALEEENHLLSQQVTALTDQNDFQEELIVELANIVYA